MKWLNVNICPACECCDTLFQGKLQGFAYKFGDEVILFPSSGIPLVKCSQCTLIYKTVIPSSNFLAEVFTQQAAKVWANKYNFSDETNILKNLAGGEIVDLLDVGAANGELLKACSNIKGRKSALDIIKQPELNIYNGGEFIQGILDNPALSWSKNPYDIITLFDVIEHLYKPDCAFRNLKLLIKDGGFLVIETGDVESYWPQSFGVNQWNYAGLFEHHVFWSRTSLARLAKKYGFQVVSWTQKIHKSSFKISVKSKIGSFIKSELYRLYPKGYYHLSLLLGKSGSQPGNSMTKDHFQVVLKKIQC